MQKDSERPERVRRVLKLLFRSIKYLGQEGLPLRGQSHRDEVLWQPMAELKTSWHMICLEGVSGFSYETTGCPAPLKIKGVFKKCDFEKHPIYPFRKHK